MSGKTLPTQRNNCSACGRALTRHEQFAGGYCSDWQCRRHRIDAENRAERLAIEHQADLDRDAAALRSGDAMLRQAPLVIVRRYHSDLEPVPEAQRDALRAHLMALLPEVEALAALQVDDCNLPTDDQSQAEAAPQQAGSEVDELLGQVCARCTGFCCQTGNGRMAYLDAPALLRAQRAHPDASHQQIVDDYLAAVPQLHHAKSCAFHGQYGCALPRERRADICNDYECDGLTEARRHAEESNVRRVLVVRHDREHPDICGFAPPLDSSTNG